MRNVAIRYVILLLFAMDVVFGLPTSANLREAPAGASTKDVSMGKAKAASPPITNFSASACRLTPVFSVPVIILPIDAQSLDINNILIILIIVKRLKLLPGMTTLFRDLQEAYPWCL